MTLTGPRQSGKTTLCRTVFPALPYFNMERPDLREATTADPRGFLAGVADGAIVDEVQRVPDLLSYLQVYVDERRRNGMFVLTGSEQFRLSESIAQSLAGRTAILQLLPFSIEEAAALRPSMTIDEMLFTGFYPRIYDQALRPSQALGDYFAQAAVVSRPVAGERHDDRSRRGMTSALCAGSPRPAVERAMIVAP